MQKKVAILSIICSLSFTGISYAQTLNINNLIQSPVSNFNKENLKHIRNNDLTNDFFKIITFAPNAEYNEPEKIDYSKKYSEATTKFTQGNITAAYKDFKTVISAMEGEDFVNIGLAYKFANLGLFSLSQEAINNIKDRELYNNQIQQIKTRLFPQVVLSYDDEIELAEKFTEIYYNNLAFEVARDMNKDSDKYKRSDYAHYILSQAYYNIKEYNKAINEINKALSINPDNANYVKYKAQIYCETNRYSEAIKLLDYMLAQDMNIMDYRRDIKTLRYYTLAKSEKDREKSRFYLAKYFLQTGDTNRAIKELNQNIAQNKKAYNSITLLADIEFKKNNLAKAMELYEKAYKIKKNNPDTLMGLGNMYEHKKDYKNSLDFYQKVLKKDKKNREAMIDAAFCNKMLGTADKANELTNKALSGRHIAPAIYHKAAKIDDIKNIQHLKKAISMDPLYIDAWLDLAEIEIKNNNISQAKIYLKTVKYLEKNNYKYFYYSGLIKKQQGNKDGALVDFKKSLEINPFFEEASKELSSDL